MSRGNEQHGERTAFAIWEDHIAPVFDVSQRLHVVEARDGRIVGESVATLPTGDDPATRGRTLAGLGIRILVCGAISRPLLAQIQSHDITVMPFIAGRLGPVITAWLAGSLGDDDRFAMPGCCGRTRRRHRGGRGPADDNDCPRPRCGGGRHQRTRTGEETTCHAETEQDPKARGR